MEIVHYRTHSNVPSTSRDTTQQDDEEALKWAALERLPTYERARKGFLLGVTGDFKETDLQKLGFQDRKELLDRLIGDVDNNEEFLNKLKSRMDRFWNFFSIFLLYSLFFCTKLLKLIFF